MLLDLSMPGRGGLECVNEIKSLCPSASVLIYTVHPEDELGVRALRAGADGYLTKDRPPDEVVNAVRRVLDGKRYISESMADRMAEHLRRRGEGEPHEELSDREYQILARLGHGKPVSEIAEELHLSVKTVSTYRTRVLQKLNLETTGELIRYAVEHRIQ